MDSEHLIPWYAIEADTDRQQIYNRPVSATFVEQPTPKPDPQETAKYRPAYLVMMELAVRARKDVQEDIPFQWPDDIYKKLCTSWFNQQKEQGLTDIIYLCGNQVASTTRHYEQCCLVCWYDNGTASSFIPSTAKDGKPVIKPLELERTDYKMPSFPDNIISFEQALQEIADYAPFDAWKQRFQLGLSIIQNGDEMEFSGQEGTFPIPKPFFKYLYAASVTQLGYGMGSWYDLPIANTDEFKHVTSFFQSMRDIALMYAINKC